MFAKVLERALPTVAILSGPVRWFLLIQPLLDSPLLPSFGGFAIIVHGVAVSHENGVHQAEHFPMIRLDLVIPYDTDGDLHDVFVVSAVLFYHPDLSCNGENVEMFAGIHISLNLICKA